MRDSSTRELKDCDMTRPRGERREARGERRGSAGSCHKSGRAFVNRFAVARVHMEKCGEKLRIEERIAEERLVEERVVEERIVEERIWMDAF